MPGNLIAIGALSAWSSALLLQQPDLGMTAVVTATWFAQFFLAGLPFIWVVAAGAASASPAWSAPISCFPHVRERVDRFLDPAAGDTYQIDRALEAFHEWRPVSAAARAKARSRWCCPTRIPTSSSPSPARSSA